jgi:hypothetical protein
MPSRLTTTPKAPANSTIEHVDKNYASMLPIMDKLFGTWYMPKKQWPTKYGIDAPMATGLVGQLLQPLVPENAKPNESTAAFRSTVSPEPNRQS